jgi:hypothetical protein
MQHSSRQVLSIQCKTTKCRLNEVSIYFRVWWLYPMNHWSRWYGMDCKYAYTFMKCRSYVSSYEHGEGEQL